jgi:hypothetical protein
MKRGIVISLFLIFCAANFAEANVGFFNKYSDKKITVPSCVMSYTDAQGIMVRVIRTVPMIIYVR